MHPRVKNEKNYSLPNSFNARGNHRKGGRWKNNSNMEQPQQERQQQNNTHVRNKRYRRNTHYTVGDECSLEQPAQNEPPELPGMYFDKEKGKYFAITAENSGIAGYSSRDIEAKRKREALINEIEVNRQAIRARPGIRSITMLTSALQIGGRKMNMDRFQRKVAESRVVNIKSSPHSRHDVENIFSYQEVTGCKFLSTSKDGTSIFGCWTGPNMSFSSCTSVLVDKELQREAFHRLERDETSIQNTMGLKFVQSPYGQVIDDPEVVDMCIAPMDTEVTGCLYVTANTMISNNQLRSRCSVFLHPLVEWSSPENMDIDSPIYNIFWSGADHIWSCGWSPNKMYISLGMEEAAKIRDIVQEKTFLIWSKGQSVMCQKFTQDGNIIIMAPRGKNMMCSDLRMKTKHCIDGKYDWPNTQNCCFLQPLKDNYRDHVLTQSFNGDLLLWDLRKKNQPVLEYQGHPNRGYKLSCIVDPEERFVFAVGSDGCTRGWSISSGELLCELCSPRPLTEKSEFPHLAYSDSWGGVAGNVALAVAHGSCIDVHQLDL